MEQKELHDTVNDKIINSKAEFRCSSIFVLCRMKGLILNTHRPAKIGTQNTLSWHGML